jgi:adenosine deaminase
MGDPTPSPSLYRSLPKVELHRHLEGSLRLDTMLDIAREFGVTVPASLHRLSGLVQVQEQDPLTFQNFLAKFNTLRLFYRSPEVIRRVAREAVEDAARDNVRYMELRFTPVALGRAESFPLREVMGWVCSSAAQAAAESGIRIGLIASVNRHESTELAEQVATLAVDFRDRGVVGMDLAGNEAEFSAEPFAGIFAGVRQAGLHLTIHAGEWAGAANVREAIEGLEAERIGHGVRVMEDESVVALALERGTTFEVCVTSNYQSGVVNDLRQHQLPAMLRAGLDVTINTDDPSVSRIDLSHEYQLVCEEFGVPLERLKERVLAAAEAAFLVGESKDRLVATLKQELNI